MPTLPFAIYEVAKLHTMPTHPTTIDNVMSPESGSIVQPTQPIEYVVGLLFSFDWRYVVLIEKTHPEWQKGKWNGVGGKLRPGEPPEVAMPREFAEETGVSSTVIGIEWELFLRLEGDWGKVHFFMATLDRAHSEENTPDLMQMEEERPAWISMELVRNRAIPMIDNLRWIIPLAFDETTGMTVAQDIPINNA